MAGIGHRRAQRNAGFGGDLAQSGFHGTGLCCLLKFFEVRTALPQRLLGTVCAGVFPADDGRTAVCRGSGRFG